MSSSARVIGFPGDTSIGPGATRRFTMDMPCSFTGRRFVVQAIDTANGGDMLVMVRSITHDNVEFIGDGRTSLVPTVSFPPPIWRFRTPAAGISVTASGNPTPFHEHFEVGDLFTITIFNQSAANVQMVMYWISDYGEKCGCKKSR